jgi:hypothetical protein
MSIKDMIKVTFKVCNILQTNKENQLLLNNVLLTPCVGSEGGPTIGSSVVVGRAYYNCTPEATDEDFYE